MKKLLLILILSFFYFNLIAQSSYLLEGKNLKATINSTGDLFWNPNTFGNGFEIPKNSGKSTIFAGQIWIGGVDSASGEYLASAQTYRQTTRAWHEGPISTVYNGNYDQVYSVTSAQVNAHITNFTNPNYTLPQNFIDWPAEGDINNGEPVDMAPYIDFNQNGTYDPINGDHPRTRGNSAAYSVFNDIRDTIPFQGSPCCFGVDVHSYVYDLSYSDPDLENTLFLNYRIVNRSNRTYEDIYVSMWMDADIGFAADDYIGCDSANSMFFAYNADNDDDVSGNGYGLNPPAQGFIFLSHPMSKFLTYNNNSDPIDGNPTSDLDYFNYTRGIWRDSTIVTFGEDGKNQNNSPTSYMYSGNGWTEEGEGNVAGDRRALGSIGPFKLSPGEELSFDFALLFFWDSTVNNFANRDSLISKTVDIQEYYQTKVLSISKGIEDLNFSIYPNPTKYILNILFESGLNKEYRITATSLSGRQFDIPIFNRTINSAKLDVSKLSSGIYIFNIQTEEGMTTRKVIIE